MAQLCFLLADGRRSQRRPPVGGAVEAGAAIRVNAAGPLTRWRRRYIVIILMFLGCMAAFVVALVSAAGAGFFAHARPLAD